MVGALTARTGDGALASAAVACPFPELYCQRPFRFPLTPWLHL
jgi:hypothetical protein